MSTAAARSLSPELRALASLTDAERDAFLASLDPIEQVDLAFDWRVWARPDQLWRPGPETYTMYLSGRGWGKTRTGAEAVRYVAERPDLCAGRILIAGRTAADIRETMIDGESGLLAVSHPDFFPDYQPSRARVVWPNGVVAQLLSADEPRTFRGPQFGFGWLDEWAHWPDPMAFANLEMDMRLGDQPRCIITTTPIGSPQVIETVFECDDNGRPLDAVEGEPSLDGYRISPDVRLVIGSTYDNAANLSPSYIDKTIRKYEGTTLGAQELHGRIILAVPGALFRSSWWRRRELETLPQLERIVVLVDPAVSTNADSAETGIICGGLGRDGWIYLLEDASGAYSPGEWSRVVVGLASKWDADEVAVEDNQGGDLLEHVMREAQREARTRFPVRRVRATKSKFHRWGMAATTWEQGRVCHVGNPRSWVHLEHQLLSMSPDKAERSQKLDRGDAAVWLVLYLTGHRTDADGSSGMSDVDAWAAIRSQMARRRR